MYNYNIFIEDLFSFIKTDLNTIQGSEKDNILSDFLEVGLTKEQKEHNHILYTKLESFLNDYFLIKNFGEIEFHLNGHKLMSEKNFIKYILRKTTSDIFYEIKVILENKNKLIDILTDNPKFRNHEHFNCEKCASAVYYYFDFENLKLKTTDSTKNKECSIEETEYKINLRVPSKKLVFTNYFDELLDEDKYDLISLNSYKGLVELAKAYESDNIGYMYVGNTCPSVYLKEDKSEIKVGKKGEYKGFNKIGYVCTDLWAICFMDYEQFLSLLEKKGFTEESYESSFFKVEIDSEEIEVISNNILFKESKELFFSIKTI